MKCTKRGLVTTDGQIPIEKHYRSLITSGLVGLMGNGDLWGFIITHKSEWGFMATNNLGLAINPHKSPFRFMGNYKSPFPINPTSPDYMHLPAIALDFYQAVFWMVPRIFRCMRYLFDVHFTNFSCWGIRRIPGGEYITNEKTPGLLATDIHIQILIFLTINL